MSPPPHDGDDDSKDDAARLVSWMDESLDTLDGMGVIVLTTDEVPWARGEGRDLAWQSVREMLVPNMACNGGLKKLSPNSF